MSDYRYHIEKAALQIKWGQKRITQALSGLSRTEITKLCKATGVKSERLRQIKNGDLHDARMFEVCVICSALKIKITDIIPEKAKHDPTDDNLTGLI
jgi:DNA-binding Xre family transcriptional regulator